MPADFLDELYVRIRRYSRTIVPLIARILITSAFIQDSVDT